MAWDIHVFWFFLLGVLLAGYAILDGFDLGVGILHLFVKKDLERRLFLNSIGPLWDGNEVWLVTFGGALFAAFPRAYAAAFSGFYVPFMLVLFALIFRGVSIEFRSKSESPKWRSIWDICFSAASTMAAFLFGGGVGSALEGAPLQADGDFISADFDLFRPFPILVGLLAICACAMHGSIYLYLKNEGELQQRIKSWMWRTFFVFLAAYMLVTLVTLSTMPWVLKNFQQFPVAWVIVLLNALSIANIPRAIHQNRPLYAFVSSCCTFAALTFFFGIALFPNLLVSSIDPAYNLTIYNAASSEKTLQIMRIVAFLGMPFVLSYTGTIYWVFRGKVKLGKFSY